MYLSNMNLKHAVCDLNSWRNEYEQLSKNSRDEYLHELKPGDTVPPEGYIYGDSYRKKWMEKAGSLRADIRERLEAHRADINAAMATAPSEEGLRATQMFLLRIDPERVKHAPKADRDKIADEIDAMMSKYGDYQTYTLLKQTAEKCGFYDFHEHPAERAMEKLDSAIAQINRHVNPINTLADGMQSWKIDCQIDTITDVMNMTDNINPT